MQSIPKPPTWLYMPLYEKIQYYKEYLNEKHAQYVDKIAVKEIIASGKTYIKTAPIVRILKDVNDITENDLGKSHILKASHGSGWNICLQDKQLSDIPIILESLKKWNKVYVGNDEPHYKYLEPRFFIEECIDDFEKGNTSLATVFLIRCILGKAVTISVKKDQKQNSYDLSWNLLRNPELPAIEKPEYLNELLSLAEELAKPFEFVRIDLYKAKNGYYLSEFTFTPAGGNPYFSLKKEKELGKLWMP
jgi:hypothetical protein